MNLRCLSVVLLLVCGDVLRAEPWNMLFVFGDSYSDSGAGYVYGDGATAVVHLAEGLAIPFTHANDPQRAGKGLNFAVSGAQTGSGLGRRIEDKVLGLGMWNQVEDFISRVKSGEVKFDPERTLFFIAGGLNDVRVPTETTVANLCNEMRLLHRAGARHFMIALLPTKIPGFGITGRRLNPALAKIPEIFQMDGATVRISRWGEFFDAVYDNPKAYGILNITDACAGRALFGEDPTPRGDPKTYYFYYSGHPSAAVHRVVGERLLNEVRALKP